MEAEPIMRTIWMQSGLIAITATFAGAAHAQAPKEVKVDIKTSTGQPAGTAIFRPAKDGGIKLKIKLMNIPLGDHGVHIHEHALCDAPDFKTAGGHFNPTSKQHGYANPLGHHAGDLPQNVTVGEGGMGEATFTLPDLSMDPLAPNSIFAGGGTAIVVHEKADDEKSNPSGNSGNRIACGVIQP
jgi:Cu-Zn family superoxide dismutase